MGGRERVARNTDKHTRMHLDEIIGWLQELIDRERERRERKPCGVHGSDLDNKNLYSIAVRRETSGPTTSSLKTENSTSFRSNIDKQRNHKHNNRER